MDVDFLRDTRLLFSGIIPLVGLITAITIMIFVGGRLPSGFKKDSLVYYLSFVSCFFFMVIMSRLPLPKQINLFLNKLAFALLLSFLPSSCLMFERDRKGGVWELWILAFAFLCLFVMGFAWDMVGTSEIIPVIELLLIFYILYFMFTKTISCGNIMERNQIFCRAVGILISGITVIADLLMIPRWQEGFFLSYGGIIFSSIIIPLPYTWSRFTEEQVSGSLCRGILSGTVSVFILIFLSLPVYFYIEKMMLDMGNFPSLWFPLLPIGVVLAGIYIPLEMGVGFLLNAILKLPEEDFSSQIDEWLKNTPEEERLKSMGKFIGSRFPGMESWVFIRPPHWRVMRTLERNGEKQVKDSLPEEEKSGGEKSLFTPRDLLLMDDKMMNIFKRKEPVIIDKKNVEEFLYKGTLYEKMLRAVEKGTFLVISGGYHNSQPPVFLLIFYKRGSFSFLEIRKLSLLSPHIEDEVKGNFNSRLFPPLFMKQVSAEKDIDMMVKNIYNEIKKHIPIICIVLFYEREKGLLEGSRFPFHKKYLPFPCPDMKNSLEGTPGEIWLTPRWNSPLEKEIGYKVKFLSFNTPCGKEAYLGMEIQDKYFVLEKDSVLFFNLIKQSLTTLLEQHYAVIELAEMEEKLAEIEKIRRESCEAVYRERLKMAGEIHDTVAQDIYSARMQMDLIHKMMQRELPTDMEDIKGLQETLNQGLRGIREIINRLREKEDRGLKEESLYNNIINILKKNEKKFNIRHENLDMLIKNDGYSGEEVLFILLESLNNIIKHSHAKNIFIRVKIRSANLFLLVIDDGRGFNIHQALSKKNSYGLKGLFEKADKIKGKIYIKSVKKRGTALLFRSRRSEV